MKLIDYHTHYEGCEKYKDDHDVLVIQSVQCGEPIHPRADYVTIGLHPMLSGTIELLPKGYDHIYATLQNNISNAPVPVIAIGECGWDKRSALTEEEQSRLMELQIALSEKLGLPILLHIVGAWHLLLRYRKKYPRLPWIVHGFRGNSDLARQLAVANIGISLHPQVIMRNPEILPDPFFIETDESEYPIRTLYEKAAEFRGVEMRHLAENIINGFYSTHLL